MNISWRSGGWDAVAHSLKKGDKGIAKALRPETAWKI